MACTPYKLRCIIYAHLMDVRCVTVDTQDVIISGSRDRSAKLWRPHGADMTYVEVDTYMHHSNFVSAVCVLPSSNSYKLGLIVTGSHDRTICGFMPGEMQPVFIIKAHTNTVCNLALGLLEDTFISSSWDATARLWGLEGKALATYMGHSGGVWAAIQMEHNQVVVTASADSSISIWSSGGSRLKTLGGHTDCARYLASVSPTHFLSCGNDGYVIHWDVTDGSCLSKFLVHDNYLYSISAFLDQSSGDNFVVGGEGRLLHVWHAGECTQTLTLPGQSVWCTSILPNQDIVCGSSDGNVYVFSADPSRQACDAVLALFEAEIEKTNVPASDKGVAGEKMIAGKPLKDLPTKVALNTAGERSGQQLFIREGDQAFVYLWNSTSFSWEKFGEALPDTNPGPVVHKKQYLNGKEYDYVFSVVLEEDGPKYMLPYNVSEDPWVAAHNFLQNHDLRMSFLDEVAQFIVSNSQAIRTPAAQQAFSDPFTGGSRYIPSTGQSIQVDLDDPLSGGSRYIPGSASVVALEQQPPARVAVKEASYFPQEKYLRFDQANFQVILDKLQELNRKAGDGVHSIEGRLLEGVVKMGELGSTSDPLHLQVLKQLLEWPQDMVFPALDITRLAIRNASTNRDLCSGQTGLQLMGQIRGYLRPASSNINNQVLALRIVCNMLQHSPGEKLALAHAEYLLSAIQDLPMPMQGKIQVASATLMLNMSVAFRNSSNLLGLKQAVTVACDVVPRLTDAEATFRGLVALGTMVWHISNSRDRQQVVDEVNRSLDMQRVLKQLSDAVDGVQVKLVECATLLLALLQMA